MDKVPVRCGLDIAKHVMAIHTVNHSGTVVIRKNISREILGHHTRFSPLDCIAQSR